MNNQEFFTRTVQHLRRQGIKSIDDNFKCRYRTNDGRMCAIGCHLDDAHYAVVTEGTPIARLFGEPLLAALFAGVDLNLLCSMETIHDRHPVGRWEHEFAKRAERHGLEVPALEAA